MTLNCGCKAVVKACCEADPAIFVRRLVIAVSLHVGCARPRVLNVYVIANIVLPLLATVNTDVKISAALMLR